MSLSDTDIRSVVEILLDLADNISLFNPAISFYTDIPSFCLKTDTFGSIQFCIEGMLCGCKKDKRAFIKPFTEKDNEINVLQLLLSRIGKPSYVKIETLGPEYFPRSMGDLSLPDKIHALIDPLRQNRMLLDEIGILRKRLEKLENAQKTVPQLNTK
jgi:hypothetical protein